jgi:hypothetical protein
VALAKRVGKSDKGNTAKSSEIDHTNTADWSLKKKQKPFFGERVVFSANGARTTGYPHIN